MNMSEWYNSVPESLPKIFIFELTRSCNHQCLYCYNVWKGENYGKTRRQISLDEIKQSILKLQSETEVESIGISGGEPLLREDLPEILSFIREQGITPVIATNGTLLTKDKVATTMPALYEVTLLSHRPEVHDALTGCKGSWKAAFEGILNIKEANGNFIIVFVATKLNFMDIQKTTEMAIALGAVGLMYNRMNLGAGNIKNADRLLPTQSMIQENLDTLEKIGEQYGLPIVVSVVLEPCVIDTRDYKNIQIGWCPLGGENSYFTIDPEGNVRICNHSPVILGNILQDRFSDIYYNNPHVIQFRNTLPKECINCSHDLKDKCAGGCKAAAEQCYGTLDRVDPFVSLTQEKIRKS
jgi:radical SAM protein with 4Fe4S-binding SPASM domain